MNFKWTPILLDECRNTRIVPYKNLSCFARRALLMHFARLEVYTEAGWIPALRIGLYRPDPERAYRVPSGFNPLVKR